MTSQAETTAEGLGSAHTIPRRSVYVYEAPLRLWHWVNAACIVVLAVTGYLIASPPPSVMGQASDHFIMGDIRFVHFAAAYIFGIGFLGRIYWAIVGNEHARQIFYVPFWSRSYWGGVAHEIGWYLFLKKKPRVYVGHNPLAHLAMFFLYTVMAVFMIMTGGAMYAEGTGLGSWQDRVFGWFGALFGNPQNLHTWHHMGMWVIVIFVIIHVYVAIREDIMSRQSIVSSMISGWRQFKDDRPAEGEP